MAAPRSSDRTAVIKDPLRERVQGTHFAMQVLAVATTATIYPNHAAPPWLTDQVRSLCEAGMDVDLLTFQTHRTRLNYGRIVPALVQRLHSGRYDLLHTYHTYTFLLADFARALARRHIPILLTYQEGQIDDPEGRARTWHPTSYLRHSVFLKRYTARRADFVIFGSEQHARALPPEQGHAVIPCGLDLEKFRPLDRSWCREKLGIPRDEFVVFFAASPKTRFKRFELADAAYQSIRRHRPGALMLVAGSIPHDAMPHYYNAADVVLQSSFYEASPTVVKEALACEVPLVSTDAGDTRAVIQGVPNCFVCHDDPDELGARALECQGKRSSGGRERLLELGLSLEQIATRLINVYQQVGDRRTDPGQPEIRRTVGTVKSNTEESSL